MLTPTTQMFVETVMRVKQVVFWNTARHVKPYILDRSQDSKLYVFPQRVYSLSRVFSILPNNPSPSTGLVLAWLEMTSQILSIFATLTHPARTLSIVQVTPPPLRMIFLNTSISDFRLDLI